MVKTLRKRFRMARLPLAWAGLAAFIAASGGCRATLPPAGSGEFLLLLFAVLNAVVILAALVWKGLCSRRGARPAVARPAGVLVFHFQPNALALSRIADVAEELDRFDIPLKARFDLHLAMEELFLWALNGPSDQRPQGDVAISAERRNGALQISLEYPGLSRNPLEAAVLDLDKPLEEISLDGVEIHLLRSMVDEIRHEWRQGRNVVRLIKNLPPSGEKEGKRS